MTIKRTFAEKVQLWLAGTMIALCKLLCRLGLSKVITKHIGRMGNDSARKRVVFANYVPTKHDVLLPIHAKSGTNWLLQITQQIAYYGEAEFAHIHDLVSWPDFPLPTTVSLTDPTPQQKSPTGLRMIKSHMESDYIPYNGEATYIIVLRDPKEVFVSGYRFGLGWLLPEEMPSVEAMLATFLSPDYLYGDWARHTQSYWPWRERPNVLVMTFNELQKDTRGCIERIAAAMGVTLTTEQVDKVLAKSDVNYMKQLGFAFTAPLPPIPFWGKLARTELIRSGKSGNSGELLSPAQQNAIDDYMRAELLRLGSDFPYDAMFVTNRSHLVNTV